MSNSSLRLSRSLREFMGNEVLHLCVSLFFLLVLFGSCATAPKVSFPGENGEEELSLLPAGAEVYLWVDAVKGRPLLDVLSFDGKSGKDAGKILDSTETAAAAILHEGQGRRFFLAARGNYPRVRANLSLSFTKGWKKLKGSTGNSYWYSKNDDIALALGSDLVLVSDTDPWEILPAGIPKETPPAAFMEFRQTMALAGWVSSPSGSIDSFLSSMGIPLQIPAEELYFGAERLPADKSSQDAPNTAGPQSAPAGAPWQLVFRVRTPSVNNARSLLGLFSVARFFLQRGAIPAAGQDGLSPDKDSLSPQEAAALFFANNPEQDGAFLTFRTAPLDENKIALLFAMFSVNF